MNHTIKSLLIVLGLGLVGYALYVKEFSIRSPQSAWENNLVNAARQGEQQFTNEFNRIMQAVESGWNLVVFIGVAVVVAASFIKTRSKTGPPKE